MKKTSLTIAALLASACAFAAPKAQSTNTSNVPEYFSSMAANYIYVGAGADFVKAAGESETGVDAMLGLNFNLYKSDTKFDAWGIDLIVPLEYTYIDSSDEGLNAKQHAFTFPVYIRPYYRLMNEENLSITPFVQAGLGGRYTYMEAAGLGMTGWSSEVSFVWSLGAGVEIGFMKDFYVSGKYLYHAAETNAEHSMDYWASPEHELGVEIGWRITDTVSLLAQYKHVFWKTKHGFETNIDQDKVGMCIRIDF